MGGGCSSKTSRQKVSEVDPKQTDLRADKLPREHPHSEEDEEALNPEVKDHDPTMESNSYIYIYIYIQIILLILYPAPSFPN